MATARAGADGDGAGSASSLHYPDRGTVDEALACRVANDKWRGFWGPYTD